MSKQEQRNSATQDRPLQQCVKITELPTPYQQRQCTDICCLGIGILYTLVLVILTFIVYDANIFARSTIPADSDGKICGIDHIGYPIIYFAQPTSIARRVCVSKCPSKGDTKLQCAQTENIGCRFSSTPGFEMKYYDNQFTNDRNGLFCYPKDQAAKQQLIQSSQLVHRNSVYNSLDTIILSCYISLGLSILYFLLVQCLPTVMNRVTVVTGVIIMLGLAVCTFIYSTSYKKSQLAAGIILIILVLLIVANICHNPDSWSMHGIFLNYSTKFTSDQFGIIIYIPLFLAFMTAFIFLLIWEFKSFWSSGQLSFDAEKSLYYEFKGAGGPVFSALMGIQALWGLSFIKQAFNFCIAGNTVLWYYKKQDQCCQCLPFKMLWCKHWGSIIAGSFMTGFFSLADFIFDFIKPDENSNPQGCYTQCYGYCCCCTAIFDLVRSDAMAYIALTGNPYCNSSRYCQYLCNQSIIMDYSQSTSRAYRICAHFLIAGTMALLSLYINGNIPIIAMMVVLFLCLFISTFFISIHADATEAIQIIFLNEQQLSKRNKQQGQNFRESYDRKDIQYAIDDKENLQPQLAKEVKEERRKQNEIKKQDSQKQKQQNNNEKQKQQNNNEKQKQQQQRQQIDQAWC